MADPDSRSAGSDESSRDEDADRRADDSRESATATGAGETSAGDLTTDELRARVEEKYDFENFGPADMAEMSPEEWEAVFDPDTWITGEALLDRVEADLKRRVLDRDVFARVERFGDVVVAYTHDEYAAVYPDGSVEGVGTVLRDVEPTVALCSMDSYEVPDAPAGPVLPEPREIPESSDTLGNTLLQALGGVQIVAGLVLLGAAVLYLTGLLSQPQTSGRGINLAVMVVAGVGFLLVGVFLLFVVANARLSDRFRSEQFRERLRGVGLADGERPAFLAEIDGVQLPLSDRQDGGNKATSGNTTNPDDDSDADDDRNADDDRGADGSPGTHG